MYFLQFSSVTSAVNNVYNLVTWKGSRKNLEWTCMDNIDHASRNRLSSSSMRRAAAASAWRNERTYNTHATNESFFVQENMAKQSDQQSTRCRNKSRDLWRSLAISDDLWRSHGMYSDVWCLFVQLRHLLEFLRVVGSGLPDSSTAGCGSLQMSMLRHAATNPPIFNHRCQCLQTWNDTEMGFPTCYLVRLCYGFQTTRATVFGIRQC